MPLNWSKSILNSLKAHQYLVIGGIGVLAVMLAVALIVVRTQSRFNPQVADRQALKVTGPITVSFGQDVASGFVASIQPNAKGAWKPTGGLLGASGVVFKPSDKLAPGERYTITIKQLRRFATGQTIPDVVQQVQVQLPADIKSVSPTAGASAIAISPRLSLELAAKNAGIRDLQASLTPAVELKLIENDDQTFVWQPVAPLKQGTSYTFTVKDTSALDASKQTIASTTFTTVTAPRVLSARTGDHLAPGQTIEIGFDQPMDATTKAIVFEMGGAGTWKDDHTYSYKPADLKPGTTYSYHVKTGLATKAGGTLEADQNFQISTNGAVTASAGPGGSELGLNTPVSFSFDQAVDHGSAESRFSIAPSVPGAFSWSGNTMTWRPSGMGYETKYIFSLGAGVTAVWGLPSAKVFSGAYTTAPEVVKLSVPARGADYTMGCELATLNMLLKYRGIKTTDWDILMKLGYNPRSRDTATNTWDDPNLMYVGDVNGWPTKTGYGVHAGPLAAAGRTYGRDVQAYYNVSAAWISQQVHNGNPVLFYGYSNAAPRGDSWNTPGGKVVQTVYPQHARVIWGVKGSAANPWGFWMNETMTAGTQYWSAAQVMANMNAVPGVSNMAVVVY